MRRVLKGEIVILPVTKWVFDCFTGKGWENHSRFHLFKGHLKLVSGQPVTEGEYNTLKALLTS